MKTIIGSLLIFFGSIYFVDALGIFEFTLFFDGWWTLFILIPSINSLFKKEYTNFFLGTSIAVLLLLAANDVILYSTLGKLFLPIVLIVLGINLLFTKKLSLNIGKGYTAIFAGVEEKVKEVKDIDATAIFGGVDLDLRELKIDKDININLFTIFGGIDIILPDNVELIVKGMPIFGGVENKYDKTGKHKVYVNYSCLFAGISIK